MSISGVDGSSFGVMGVALSNQLHAQTARSVLGEAGLLTEGLDEALGAVEAGSGDLAEAASQKLRVDHLGALLDVQG